MSSIIKIKRMFPAGAIVPQGMPYINMEEVIRNYCEANCGMSYNHIYVYMNMSLIPDTDETESRVVGVVSLVNTDSFYVRFTDNSAYDFVLDNTDHAVIRIVSDSSTCEHEYGVRVNKIIRFEIDMVPEEC